MPAHPHPYPPGSWSGKGPLRWQDTILIRIVDGTVQKPAGSLLLFFSNAAFYFFKRRLPGFPRLPLASPSWWLLCHRPFFPAQPLFVLFVTGPCRNIMKINCFMKKMIKLKHMSENKVLILFLIQVIHEKAEAKEEVFGFFMKCMI